MCVIVHSNLKNHDMVQTLNQNIFLWPLTLRKQRLKKREGWRRETAPILSRSALCALTWSSSWLCHFCWVTWGLCLYGPEPSSWCLLPQSPDPSLAYSAACYPRDNSHTDMITSSKYPCSISKQTESHSHFPILTHKSLQLENEERFLSHM